MKYDRLVLAVSGALALASCIDDPLSRYYPTESQRYLRDSFGPRYQVTGPPVYCYATIGDPDCYAVPVPGWEHRLIAHYGPRPY
jgi:hypothetical protein